MKGWGGAQEGRKAPMSISTINLDSSEDSAAITILRGIHGFEAVGSFVDHSDHPKAYVVFVRTDELTETLNNFQNVYELAEKRGATSEPELLWRYLHSEVLSDEAVDEADDAEDYRNATR